MTDPNQPPIVGYPAYTDTTVSEVNTNKRIEERCLRRIEALLASQELNIDPYWADEARFSIMQAFMFLNRAIFKPARVYLNEDAQLPGPYTPPLPAALRAQRDAHIMPEPQPDLTDKDDTSSVLAAPVEAPEKSA